MHDAAFELFPDSMPPERARSLRLGMPAAMARARRILVPTAAVRDELSQRLGIPASKVVVTPEASFLAGRGAATTGVLEGLGLERGYLLGVGTLEPRKRFELLIAAHAELGPEAPPLVIAGRPGWGESAALAEHARPRVRFLTGVEDEQLAAVYEGARLLAFPSLYEGFGLPVLEAMACGVPVVASRAVAEVAGSAARIVSEDTPAAWARALAELLHDPVESRRLSDQGRARAAGFSWVQCARATIDAYRAALDGAGRA